MKDVIKRVPTLFYECFSLCNSKHIQECSCQDVEIDKVKKVLLKQNLEDLTKEQRKDKGVIDQIDMLSYNQAIKEVGSKLKKLNIRCPLQVKYYSEFLEAFKDVYNLEDARVIEILSSLFRMFVKMKLYYAKTENSNPLITLYDKEGNKTYQINPIEAMILKYEKARVDVLEKLDKIINGQKSIIGIVDFKEEMINIFNKRHNVSPQTPIEDKRVESNGNI